MEMKHRNLLVGIIWNTNNMEYEYLKDIMRKERNQLLKDCDYCALPEFPNRENYIFKNYNIF
jgi:hypothetical protein